ncbi:MAG: hypothetical protein LBH29_03820 [Elusimicrobiota bacterium]|nr:hypothetical protein [Elusimicrobiota bacterium]
MKILKAAVFFFAAFVFYSCSSDVTYRKENLAADLINLLKKEYGIDSKVFLFPNTVYLDIDLGTDAPQKDTDAAESFKKINGALTAAIRTVISGDSEIKFAVVNAYPQDKSVLFRIIQNIDDFKSYYYMRISIDDFSSRNIIEIKSPSEAAAATLDKRDIRLEEFVGRLIVSSVMSSAGRNPFLAALLSNLKLDFESVKDGVLILRTNADLISESRNALSLQLQKETELCLKKYSGAKIERVIVFGTLKNKNVRLIDFKAGISAENKKVKL